MNPVMIDTDILSMFFRKNVNVIENMGDYLEEYNKISFSIITYYEILSGLKHKNAVKQITYFLEFAEYNTILPLTEKAVLIASDLYADLRKEGKPLDDIDLFIAAIAMSNNLTLVTHNRSHFDRIKNLNIQDWSLTA